MGRYYAIKISAADVYQELKRNGVNRFSQNQRKRSIHKIKRYEKQVMGGITFKLMSSSYPLLIDRGKKIKRYQYRPHSAMNDKIP